MERSLGIFDLGDIRFLPKEVNEEQGLARDGVEREIELTPVWGEDGFPRLTDDMRRAKNKER